MIFGEKLFWKTPYFSCLFRFHSVCAYLFYSETFILQSSWSSPIKLLFGKWPPTPCWKTFDPLLIKIFKTDPPPMQKSAAHVWQKWATPSSLTNYVFSLQCISFKYQKLDKSCPHVGEITTHSKDFVITLLKLGSNCYRLFPAFLFNQKKLRPNFHNHKFPVN